MREIFECLKQGLGYPNLRHDPILIANSMHWHGHPIEEARLWVHQACMSPCPPTKHGFQPMRMANATANCAKIIEYVFSSGYDSIVNMQVGAETPDVTEFTDFLISKDIFPKVTGVTEWVSYTDHCRWREMEKAAMANGFLSSFTSGLWKEKAWYHVEGFYKSMVEHKIARHMKPTGLIPEVPHDMNEIVGNSEKHFIDPELESEATCSSGVAATGMIDGYAGVAIIAPFACLPGRLIEGVYTPWARKRDYPVISLENDGQPYPPNVIARMEIFAHNVSRYEKS